MLLSLLPAGVSAAAVENQYGMKVEKDGSVAISMLGHTAHFRPHFSILVSDTDPSLKLARDSETAYDVPSWLPASSANRTTDLFGAGEVISIDAAHTEVEGTTVRWTFPEQPRFRLQAKLVMSPAGQDPVIEFQFTALAPGWYSIGYTGSPEVEQSAITRLWQPLVWQERRFPSHSFLSMELMCSLPAVFVQSKDDTVGLSVDPSEVPFRLPTMKNSRFGVALRNPEGRAQPMVFSPVFGLEDSHFKPGVTARFRFRIFVRDGDWFDTYRHVGQDIFGFHDYRHNGPASLNTTLDNMVDFAMNDTYSGWVPDLKAFDYTTDVVGTVKLVSALHPLSVAIIRDDPEIYRRRALPMTEYILSRQKYLYSVSETVTGQNASHLMKGPCAEVSELSALYSMSLNRTPAFSHYAEVLSKTPRRLNLNMVSTGDNFQDMLALYRMTSDDSYLEKAKAKALLYIAQRIDQTQEDFKDVHVETGGQFWTDFAPKWIDLLELYETTQDTRFLNAAEAGAKEFAQYIWLDPAVPDHDVLVNKGSKTIVSSSPTRMVKHDPEPIPAPEEMVPAWRVSQIGLTPEASTTYAGNQAVLLTHYAAYMLRLSYYTGDTFLRDIARSAVVGRYENFPGYDIKGEFTTTYQRPDYPLRPWNQLTYNMMYYNQVWPNIALLYDYLISDAFTRSKGKVNFPSRYAQGYAYLQSKVYGDRPGEVYGEGGVRLWMPGKLVQSDQPEVNYVSGYGRDALYLILMNQSSNSLQVHLRLDPNIVPLDVNRDYKVRVWHDNRTGAGEQLVQGQVIVPVSTKGITVLAIDGLRIHPSFQGEYVDPNAKPLSEQSYHTIASSFGQVNGMLLSMGRSLTSAYVWLEATEKELKEARLTYKDGDQWKTIVDSHYPFEFSLPVSEIEPAFEFYVDGVKPDGTVMRSGQVDLHR
jgi:hypothetical protein